MDPLFEQLKKDMKEANITEEGDVIAPEAEEAPAAEEPAKPAEEEAAVEVKPEAKAEEPEEDKPLSPKEQAYYRRKARELEAENKRLREAQAAPKPEPVAKKDEPKPEDYRDWKTKNPEPDKEKDLAGWLVWNAEDQRKWREEQSAVIAQSEETRRMDTLVQDAQQEIVDLEAEYRKSNNDYDNAMDFAKGEFAKAMRITNPGITEVQIKKELQKLVLQTALRCDRDRTSLGETLYDMAIERFGYEPRNGDAAAGSDHRTQDREQLEGGGKQ
jgi:hypothetical protein